MACATHPHPLLLLLLLAAPGALAHPSSLGCASGENVLKPGGSAMGLIAFSNDYSNIAITVKDSQSREVTSYIPGHSYTIQVSGFAVNQTYSCSTGTCDVAEEYYLNGTQKIFYTTPYIAVRTALTNGEGAGNFSGLSASFAFTDESKCPWQVFQSADNVRDFSATWTVSGDQKGDIAVGVVSSRGPPNLGTTVMAGPHANMFYVQKTLTGPPTPAPTPVSNCDCCNAFCSNEIPLGGTIMKVTLSWKVDEASNHIRFGLTSPTVSYVALGFGKSMVGNRAVVARPDNGEVKLYNLGGYDVSEVTPVSDSSAEAKRIIKPQYSQDTSASQTSLIFEMDMSKGITLPTANLLIAVGPNGNGWGKHQAQAAVSIGVYSGTTKVIDDEPLKKAYVKIHAIVMCVAWGFLLPLGVMMPAFKAQIGIKNGLWFQLHRAVQITGVLLTAVGFALIVIAYKDSHQDHFKIEHGKLGLAVMILAGFMPLMAVLRPHAEPKTVLRLSWEFVHKGVGYICLIAGFSNVVLGTKLDYMTSYLDKFDDRIKLALYVEVAILLTAFIYLQTKNLFKTAEDAEKENKGAFERLVIEPKNEDSKELLGVGPA